MKFALLALAALMAAPQAHAEMDRAAEGLYRIDVAGSLRMRTQRMLRDACYVASSVSIEENASEVNADLAAFQSARVVLTEGDEEIGLPAERSPIILNQFNNILSAHWERFQIYPLYIAARGYAEPHELGEMAELGEHLV